MTSQQKVNLLREELLDKIESNWHLTEIIKALDLYTDAIIEQQCPMGIDLTTMSESQLDHMHMYYHVILETI
jgi:hypothetical protein